MQFIKCLFVSMCLLMFGHDAYSNGINNTQLTYNFHSDYMFTPISFGEYKQIRIVAINFQLDQKSGEGSGNLLFDVNSCEINSFSDLSTPCTKGSSDEYQIQITKVTKDDPLDRGRILLKIQLHDAPQIGVFHLVLDRSKDKNATLFYGVDTFSRPVIRLNEGKYYNIFRMISRNM